VTALLNDARQHMLLAHWEDAGLAAEGVVALEPDCAEAHHIAAAAGLRQGMGSAALRHAQRAVELEPGSPDYQATYALARSGAASRSAILQRPAVIATIVAVLAFVMVIALAMAGRDRHRAAEAIPVTTPTGAASPLASNPNAPMPQPVRPSGVAVNRPRVAVRSTPAGPGGMLDDGTLVPNASTGMTGAAAGPTASPLGVATPPMDSTPLQRFPAPENPSTSRMPAAVQPTGVRPRTTVAAPPAAAPGGGTVFGGNVPVLQPVETQPLLPPGALVDTQPQAQASGAAPAQVSPQQYYVQREYGAAISGLQSRIGAGAATGSNYQQLAMAYQRVGDARSAEQAYESAVAAYKAQIAAGLDADVATRGLRSCERSLQMLRSR
jgi:hypothetical protein